MKLNIDEETAQKIYAILIKYAGADSKDEEDFVYRVTNGCIEYRFCGALGVGGKFHASGGAASMWWVNGYKEDQTTKSLKMAERTNYRLKILRGSMDPLGLLALSLNKRYRRKYKMRAVDLDAETGIFAPRLYILFRYAIRPYEPYLQIVFRDNIRVVKRIVEPFSSIEVGTVQYEDPNMLDKLDLLVDRIVTTTPRIKEEPKVGDKVG